jgi:O-antigen ligase
MDRTQLARIADSLVIGVALSLPWSTSATGILLVLWVLVLIPTLDWPDVRRELMTPAGGLPVLLFLLGLVGMAWADVSLVERWKGLDGFVKLLAIPLLMVQFRRSSRGLWVFGGYLIACLVLLVATTLVAQVPPFTAIPMHGDYVLVKNPATQSGEFVACVLGLLYLAVDFAERRRWLWLSGALIAMLGLLANVFFVSTGRTALVVVPVLLVLFAIVRLNWTGRVVVLAAATIVIALAWAMSPYLRFRTISAWQDVQRYEATDDRNASGERIEFAKKSLEFIREAPITGHGTGSIHRLFERAAIGQTGAEGSATTNPHNQTFAVAIQLGLVGALVLWAVWIAHLLLFRGGGLAEWIGLVVVVQNIVGSLFNSHLFDFVQGWVYVVAVGVAGGMMLGARAAEGRAGETP